MTSLQYNHRENVSDMFYTAFLKYPQWAELDSATQKNIIRKCERSCYNANIRECANENVTCAWINPIYTARYSAICYKILANLSPLSSDVNDNYHEFGRKLLRQEIDPNDVAKFSSYELCPHANANIYIDIAIRSEQKINKKYTSRYPCPKCHESRAEQEEVTSRAADEITQYRLICLNCQYRWLKG